MKPADFDYAAPTSVADALALLAVHGDAAKVLAGGQSLVPVLNMRLTRPAVLVDLNGIAELSHITPSGDTLCIGAMTRHHQVEESPLVREYCPILAEAASLIGHAAIRSRGTIGGSLVHADPAAEFATAVCALRGEFVLRSTTGERVLDSDSFFTGFMTTALAPGELLVEVRIPRQAPGTGWAFEEFARRHGDFAIVGVAATVTAGSDGRCCAARIVVTGVSHAPVPVEAAAAQLVGSGLESAQVALAARAVQAELDPLDDIHATGPYRRHLAGVLTRRALERAWAVALAG